MRPLRVALAGRLAGVWGLGGAWWATAHWLLGGEELGWEVHAVERLDHGTPESAVERSTVALRDHGFAGGVTTGHDGSAFADVAAWADVLVDLSGVAGVDGPLAAPATRIYVDLDPGFTQIWALDGVLHLEGYTHYATVGLLVGRPECPVPTLDREWIGILPPVSLRHWPPSPPDVDGPVTTIGQWRSYGPVDLDGTRFGQRAHSLRTLIELPRLAGVEPVIALGIDPAETRDLAALATGGWRVVDPSSVAATPDGYAAFVRGSSMELDVPKEGYVVGRTGWFSDRSACYLASGRPVVSLDTGAAGLLGIDVGFVAVDGVDDAVRAVRDVSGDLPRHSAAARAFAETHLDARRVLAGLVEAAS